MKDKIDEIIERGIVNIIPNRNSLKDLLIDSKKLNIYFGIDPTATKIHIGHAVPIRKLALLSDLGHNITFLIGDFTALIGDTSDKDSERPVLTYNQIKANFETYKTQAEKIIDFSKVKVVFNSEWLKELKFDEIIKLCQHFSVGDFVNRELIKKRLNEGKKVALHETLYPVMQGYDSYHLDTDIQIGSADQTFNMQAGRTLLKDISNKESYVLVTDYLIGTDGKKMSKTGGNAIWLNDTPSDMFGKVMSLKDELIDNYFQLATNLSKQQIDNYKKEFLKDVMGLKMILAQTVVKEIHGETASEEARKNFRNTFQNNTPTYQHGSVQKGHWSLAGVVSHLSRVSITESKRLITAGSVDINEKTITDPTYIVSPNDKLKIGKRQFFTVVEVLKK